MGVCLKMCFVCVCVFVCERGCECVGTWICLFVWECNCVLCASVHCVCVGVWLCVCVCVHFVCVCDVPAKNENKARPPTTFLHSVISKRMKLVVLSFWRT